MNKFPDSWNENNLRSTKKPTDKHGFTGGPFGSDLKNSDYEDAGIRVIQLQNIGEGSFINDSKVYTSLKKADELKNCNAFPGDIIISKMADPLARACILPDIESRYLMCSDAIRLAVDSRSFDKNYICNFINSNYFRTEAESVATGTTRKRIGLTELGDLALYVPDLHEQETIGKIMNSIDNSVELAKLEIEKLEKKK